MGRCQVSRAAHVIHSTALRQEVKVLATLISEGSVFYEEESKERLKGECALMCPGRSREATWLEQNEKVGEWEEAVMSISPSPQVGWEPVEGL